jgi:hypothetical protein
MICSDHCRRVRKTRDAFGLSGIHMGRSGQHLGSTIIMLMTELLPTPVSSKINTLMGRERDLQHGEGNECSVIFFFILIVLLHLYDRLLR